MTETEAASIKLLARLDEISKHAILAHDRKPDIYENSGIYSLRCNSCNMQYVGQTRRNLKTRYIENCRYINTNDPKSAYAMHILNNKHEYGPINLQ
jgi:hypothetical protein